MAWAAARAPASWGTAIPGAGGRVVVVAGKGTGLVVLVAGATVAGATVVDDATCVLVAPTADVVGATAGLPPMGPGDRPPQATSHGPVTTAMASGATIAARRHRRGEAIRVW